MAAGQIRSIPGIWHWADLLNDKLQHPAMLAQAQAIFPEVGLPYPTFQGTIAQVLRPFPQYSGVADPYGNVGQSNYNALQASLQQRLSNGLTFNVNYTFSKAVGTINGSRSAYLQEKNLSTTDIPHVFNAFYSYELPFGKGRMFNPENKVVRSLISGWQISGITRFASGTPLGPFTAGTCNPACQRWVHAGPAIIRTLPDPCVSTVTGATAT